MKYINNDSLSNRFIGKETPLISKELLEVLVSPTTGCSLMYDSYRNVLVSSVDDLEYPIVDGIPIIKASAAVKVKDKNE